MKVETATVSATGAITLMLRAGGGFVARLVPGGV